MRKDFPLPLKKSLCLSLFVSISALVSADPWSELELEDPDKRASLPEFKWIPAAAEDELTDGRSEPKAKDFVNWTRSYGDNGARRYSALDQINRSNVAQLTVAWTYHSKDGKGNIQCNPIIVDGIMYAPTVGRCIVAVDARSGKELWRYQVERPARIGLADAPARRGLLYWPGNDETSHRIIFASGNWVYALNPSDGKPIQDFGERGRTPLPTGGTAVGAVYENVLIVPGLEGDIFAYDIATGSRLWRFNTIPEPNEFGGDTWQGDNRDGAHCWGGMCLDDQRGIAYFAIGAPRTDFIGVERLGDNLFSNCVLALDAKTGQRLWHYQHMRHDIWDSDNPAPPSLVTLMRSGKSIAAVACVTKSGDTILLDRVSGKPIFPIRLRRAPHSKLPGEKTAAYQPDIELPEPFSEVEFTPEDATDLNEAAHTHVMSIVKRANYGWWPTHELDKPTLFRSTRGGAEWTGVSVDMDTGYLYVNSNNLLSMITVVRNDEPKRDKSLPLTKGEQVYQTNCAACHGKRKRGVGTAPPLIGLRHRLNDEQVKATLTNGKESMPPMPQIAGADLEALLDFLMLRDRPSASQDQGFPEGELPYTFLGYSFLTDPNGYPGVKPPWGKLNCIDLNSGKIVWSVPLGEYPELRAQGIPATGTENFGGATVTAGGLVFCAGTRDEKIRAFDKATGEELWSARLPWGGYAPPAVYQIDGKQYIVIAATGGGKLGGPQGDAYVAFALPD